MAHESNLPDGVSFGEPPNLSFSDHVHRFVALNGVQCAIDRPEPETGRDSFLNEAVILLDDVVQIRCRAAAAIAPSSPVRFKSAITCGYAGCPSTLITRGRIWPARASANRKKCLAAIVSRLGESMNSIVWPVESTARYR